MEDTVYRYDQIYLSVTYPIGFTKFVTVGLFEKQNYEVGVLLNNGIKKTQILLDFSEWNYLLLLKKCNTRFLMCEEGEEHVNKKCISNYRKSCVRIKDNNKSYVFNETEWSCFNKILPILTKYIVRLFYDQDHFKSYINEVTMKKCYVPPSFFFPSFFSCEESTRRDQQLMFDRLYDELVMGGKVGEINNFFNTDN